MIKAIIFDLDGTLLNSSRDIHETLNQTLRHFDLLEIDYSDTIRYIGNGARQLIARAVGDRDADIDAINDEYVARYAVCENSLTCLYDGESEFLSRVKSLGIKTAIVTNKPVRSTENVYGQFLKKFDFDCVMGYSGEYPLKPDPGCTLEAVRRLGVKADECIFVGDGDTDVLTAKAAGIKCVSALWGYRDEESLRSFGAENFAKNFDELYLYLK